MHRLGRFETADGFDGLAPSAKAMSACFCSVASDLKKTRKRRPSAQDTPGRRATFTPAELLQVGVGGHTGHSTVIQETLILADRAQGSESESRASSSSPLHALPHPRLAGLDDKAAVAHVGTGRIIAELWH